MIIKEKINLLLESEQRKTKEHDIFLELHQMFAVHGHLHT